MRSQFALKACLTGLLLLPWGPATAADPVLSFVTHSLQEKPGGGAQDHLCVWGTHPPKLPVLLLSKESSSTCVATTGRSADPVVGGPCTLLDMSTPCPQDSGIAAIGAKPASYRRLELAVARDQKVVEVLAAAVKASGILERLLREADPMARPQGAFQVDDVPTEVIELRGVAGRLSFVRYGYTYEGRHEAKGPPVAVAEGKATEALGPRGYLVDAFSLGGTIYLVGGTTCFGCGWLEAKFFAWENGKLRLVRKTTEQSI